MTEQTTEALIAEAKTYVTDEYITHDTRPEESLIRRLAAALEAADRRADQAEATAEHLHDEDTREIVALTQERDALAAVVEKVRTFIERQSGWFRYRAEPVSTVLATAPADALREHDAAIIEGLADEWEALVQKEKPPVRGSMWLYAQARQRREEQS